MAWADARLFEQVARQDEHVDFIDVTGHGGVTLDNYDLWAFEAYERQG